MHREGRAAPGLPRLLDAVLSVGTDLELRSTLQHIVDSAVELTGARYGALGVLDADRTRVTDLYTAGLDEAARELIGRLPDGHSGLLGALVREPRPLLVPRIRTDVRSVGFPEGHPAMDSFVGVPVRVDSQVFGNLYLTDKQDGTPFDTDDLSLLRVLAAQAGIAIGNARLYETARLREHWIEGAAAVTTALLHGTSADDALMTVADKARTLSGAAAGIVLQPTGDSGMEIVAAATGPGDDAADFLGTAIEPGSPVLDQLLGGEPVFVDDSATDDRMTTVVRSRFGPSMLLPLQSGGRLVGTLALPRRPGDPPYTGVERLLASQFASQAALAMVLADGREARERLAVFEDRDRIARDLHDLVVQRLFATEMMLESTRRRAANGASAVPGMDDLLGQAVDELDSTIQEVRTAIFALQQPPADAPTTVRGKVLRETAGAGALLGFAPSVHFEGAIDALVTEPVAKQLVAALRGALAAAHRRPGVTSVKVRVDAKAPLPDGREGVRLTVEDDGEATEGGARGTVVTWQSPL
ncbi:histidine kinase [Streptomyces spiroverticillatus]|uniref:Histidine kinase n=1 Tax=Streptomyces finlayi TaxID=67296 RepID=A0A919CCQ5_9ACTN|nr:GAF domain-containing protein [Streptomyces finlayi]GGZ95263.1 histidine kinase [Streptomyces spiroverticillatus]GHD07541.1 histidine kinase [Streptomyces finlayi]